MGWGVTDLDGRLARGVVQDDQPFLSADCCPPVLGVSLRLARRQGHGGSRDGARLDGHGTSRPLHPEPDRSRAGPATTDVPPPVWREEESMSARRHQEVAALLDRAVAWASARPDVAGLLLVGSWAADAAREDSDVDLVLLTDDPSLYDAEALVGERVLGTFVTTRRWGPVTEWRFVRESGLEVELCVGHRDWAGTSPVDPGTRRVVSDGARSLYDPRGLIAAVIDACAGQV